MHGCSLVVVVAYLWRVAFQKEKRLHVAKAEYRVIGGKFDNSGDDGTGTVRLYASEKT